MSKEIGTRGRRAIPSVILAGMMLLACFTGRAFAVDQCVALGGALVAGECRINSPVIKSGTFTLDETLRITDAGSITVQAFGGGSFLTLQITGSLIMDDTAAPGAARISGDVTGASGIGATIAVDATGDIVLHGTPGPPATGASITSNQNAGSCVHGRGGNIFLTAGGSIITENGSAITSVSPCGKGEIDLLADTSVTLGGKIASEGTTTVGRGGPVSVKAGCTLTVGDTASVVSKGRDPGADLVHLEAGCDVVIEGYVASTGPGHVNPPANQCHAPNRPDKDAGAAACVEVWAGSTITVDATGGHNGQINADTSMSGGVLCCPWIDLLAQGDISIKGDTTGAFALHANETLTNAFGGTITVKSKGGNVSASGLAIQANAIAGGGTGGTVVIEAKGNVNLDEAQIFAEGDGVATGGFGVGGTISARAFSGDLFWRNLPGGVAATGDVEPTGSSIPLAKQGIITLDFCGLNDTGGTLFPVTAGSPTTPAINAGLCPPPAAPTLPAYVTLPECLCGNFPSPDVSVLKTTSTPSVTAGSPVSYSIVVSAGGTGNSDNVVLTDTLPSGFSWTVGGTDAGACSPASPIAGGNVLTCNFGTMAPGASKSITLTAPTTAASCGTINNTATVAALLDINPNNNSSGPIPITVNCPDVGVAKTASSPTVTAGNSASYSIVVTAGGTGNSTNVTLTDTLPSGFTWTVGGANAAACSPASPVTGGTTLTCNFGTMAPLATKTITLTTPTTTENCGTIRNTATVAADVDVNPSNNSSGASPITIDVLCPGPTPADVSVVKSTSAPNIIMGNNATYTITVTANGPGTSNNVVLTDVLPNMVVLPGPNAQLSWTVGGPDAAACSPASPIASGGTLNCNFGSMASGASKTITLTAPTNAGLCLNRFHFFVSNSVSVASSNDSNPSNNASGPVGISGTCPGFGGFGG